MDKINFLKKHTGFENFKILEVGALANPVIKKNESQVWYIDHLDTNKLKRNMSMILQST